MPAPHPGNADARPKLSQHLKKRTEVAHGGNSRVIEGIENRIFVKAIHTDVLDRFLQYVFGVKFPAAGHAIAHAKGCV